MKIKTKDSLFEKTYASNDVAHWGNASIILLICLSLSLFIFVNAANYFGRPGFNNGLPQSVNIGASYYMATFLIVFGTFFLFLTFFTAPIKKDKKDLFKWVKIISFIISALCFALVIAPITISIFIVNKIADISKIDFFRNIEKNLFCITASVIISPIIYGFLYIGFMFLWTILCYFVQWCQANQQLVNTKTYIYFSAFFTLLIMNFTIRWVYVLPLKRRLKKVKLKEDTTEADNTNDQIEKFNTQFSMLIFYVLFIVTFMGKAINLTGELKDFVDALFYSSGIFSMLKTIRTYSTQKSS